MYKTILDMAEGFKRKKVEDVEKERGVAERGVVRAEMLAEIPEPEEGVVERAEERLA
jgi:hypothetical protein